MIVDCFLFFREIRLLEIRLEYLYDLVDKFVIVEAIETFTGEYKGFIFEENFKLFDKYKSKIYYYKIQDRHQNFKDLSAHLLNKRGEVNKKILDMLLMHNHYEKKNLNQLLDSYHRECLHIPLKEICKKNDKVIISDLDEIPSRKFIKNVREYDKLDYPKVIIHKEFRYYLNLFCNAYWRGAIIDNYCNIKNKSLNLMRLNSDNYSKFRNGGYHFTSIGSENEIIKKIESWAHQEFNKKIVKKNIHQNIINGRDIFYRYGQRRNRVININDKNYFDNSLIKIVYKNQDLLLQRTNKFNFNEAFLFRIRQLCLYILRFFESPFKGIRKLLKILKNYKYD